MDRNPYAMPNVRDRFHQWRDLLVSSRAQNVSAQIVVNVADLYNSHK